MTRYLDIRIASSGRFDAIRRAEYLVVLAAYAAGAVWLEPDTQLIATPFLLLALLLVPGKEPVATREELRQQTLNALRNEGLALRSRLSAPRSQPLSEEVAMARWAFIVS